MYLYKSSLQQEKILRVSHLKLIWSLHSYFGIDIKGPRYSNLELHPDLCCNLDSEQKKYSVVLSWSSVLHSALLLGLWTHIYNVNSILFTDHSCDNTHSKTTSAVCLNCQLSFGDNNKEEAVWFATKYNKSKPPSSWLFLLLPMDHENWMNNTAKHNGPHWIMVKI